MLMNGKTFIPAFDFILMIFGLATIYESNDRMTFEMLQQKCAARGVTIIPAIEAPGHVLVISQWKPELRTLNQPDLLNLSYLHTCPTMKRIWQELLPWVSKASKSIHATFYRRYVTDFQRHTCDYDGRLFP